jgi:hypothetical protein
MRISLNEQELELLDCALGLFHERITVNYDLKPSRGHAWAATFTRARIDALRARLGLKALT